MAYNARVPDHVPDDPRDGYLKRLGRWRSRRTAVDDLQFIKSQFDRRIARPHRQLGDLVGLWQDHVPTALVERTVLVSYRRGVLRVAVPDSATNYQLDRALRGGVLRLLRAAFKGNLRSVRIEVRTSGV
jgi:hypothetical protein